MRDLYLRLNIARSAPVADIKAAIGRCPNAALRADAEAVLLHANRRRSYDQLSATLTTIGRMRAALGLTHTDLWQAQDDFTGVASMADSRYASFVRRQKTLVDEHQAAADASLQAARPARWNLLERLVAAIAILVTSASLAWLAVGVTDVWPVSAWPSLVRATPAPAAPAPPASPAPAGDRVERPALPLPENGTIRRHTLPPAGVSTLGIVAKGGAHYFLVLESVETGVRVLDVFVMGGSTFEVDVPTGRYLLKFASGSTWYGYEDYFGPESTYSLAESAFTFTPDGGSTATLDHIVGGDLRTSRISRALF